MCFLRIKKDINSVVMSVYLGRQNITYSPETIEPLLIIIRPAVSPTAGIYIHSIGAIKVEDVRAFVCSHQLSYSLAHRIKSQNVFFLSA